MPAAFTDQVVLVTGGGTGIGRGIAGAFRDAGARVVVAGRRREPLEAFLAESLSTSDFIVTDVSKPEQVEDAVETTARRHGRLDVLVNNALAVTNKPFGELTLEEIRSMYDVLLLAPTLMTKAALPHLERCGGSVINTSSVAAKYVPFPPMALAVYSAAKAGVNQLTRALASELGPKGVRVNAIAPGFTRSETGSYDEEQSALFSSMTPMGRIGEPIDIAKVALFLASRDAGWVTGQVVEAAGGWGLTG